MSTGGLCALVPYFLFRVYATSSRSSFGLNIESEMSDSDPLSRFPFAPLLVSYGESAGFSSPQDSGSRPRDHVSQVPLRSQGGHIRTCAQHSCGPPQLSLHGLGHPTPTSEVSHTSHRDGVKTIQYLSDAQGTRGKQLQPLWTEFWDIDFRRRAQRGGSQ